jgi:hypothetical protein
VSETLLAINASVEQVFTPASAYDFEDAGVDWQTTAELSKHSVSDQFEGSTGNRH